jgi:hypothetical protein
MSGCDMELQKASDELKNKYGADRGVFSINPANRFGDLVISISCVTREDADRLDREIPDPFHGFHIHFSAPIWGIAGLVPENKKKFEEILYDQRYMTSGTEAFKIGEAFIEKATKDDSSIWASWNEEQRQKFISDRIKKERQRIKGYANCGDKFLLPD